MKKKVAKICWTNPTGFRPDEEAEIIGCEMIQPDETFSFRLCFKVKYKDEFVDYIPIIDEKNYKITEGENI